MAEKPSYEELARKVEELQENAAKIQQAEKTLQESEKRYRNIYDNAQVGLYRSRVRDGKIVMVNNRMAEIFGYQNTEECIAKYITAEHYVHPETRDKLLEILHEHGKFTNLSKVFLSDLTRGKYFKHTVSVLQFIPEQRSARVFSEIEFVRIMTCDKMILLVLD